MPLILLDVTNSPIYVSAAYAVGMLPYVLVTPIAGVLGDFLNKKKMIQVGELVSMALVFVLAAIPHEVTNAWLILLLHFMVSSTVAIHHPVFQAIIPNVVPKNQIGRFNSYVGTIDHLIGFSAPAMVGVLLLVSSKKMILYGISLGYLISLGAISLLAYTHTIGTQKWALNAVVLSIKEGCKYVWDVPLIKYVLWLFVGANFGTTFFYASFMYHLKHAYDIPENQLSHYLIPAGVLSIVGALIAPHLIGKFKYGKFFSLLITFAGCTLLMVTVSKNPWVTACLWGITSGLLAIVVVTFFTIRQRIVPPHLLSRTVAFTRMVAFLAIPAGAIGGGMVFKATNDFTWVSAISGTVILLTVLACWQPLANSPSD